MPSRKLVLLVLSLILGLSLSSCGNLADPSSVSVLSRITPSGTVNNSGSITKMSLSNPLQIDLPKRGWISSSAPRIPTLAISQDDKYIAAQGEPDLNEGVFLWQLADGKSVTQFNAIQAQRFLSFVGNTHQLVNELPLVWDVDSGKKLIQTDLAKGLFTNPDQQDYDSINFTEDASVSPDGTVLFGHGLDEKTSKVPVRPGFWNLQTGKLVYRLDNTPDVIAYTASFNLQTNPVATTVKVQSNPNIVAITTLNIITGQQVDQWNINLSTPKAFIKLSPDGSILVIANTNNGEKDGFWDVKTHTRVGSLPANFQMPDVITSDNRYALSYSGYTGTDYEIVIYSIAEDKEVTRLKVQYNELEDGGNTTQKSDLAIDSMALSADGKYLAVAGNRTILVWPLAELEGK